METKQKVKSIVKQYKTLFPNEYDYVVDLVMDKKQQNALSNNATGKIDGQVLERALCEYPETLSNMIISKLDSEELKWFHSREGANWFAQTFKEFNVVKL